MRRLATISFQPRGRHGSPTFSQEKKHPHSLRLSQRRDGWAVFERMSVILPLPRKRRIPLPVKVIIGDEKKEHGEKEDQQAMIKSLGVEHDFPSLLPLYFTGQPQQKNAFKSPLSGSGSQHER